MIVCASATGIGLFHQYCSMCAEDIIVIYSFIIRVAVGTNIFTISSQFTVPSKVQEVKLLVLGWGLDEEGAARKEPTG